MLINTQLRNGNLLLHKGQVKTVTAICSGAVIFLEDAPPDTYGLWVDLEESMLMPLTPESEWLERFGFEKKPIYYELSDKVDYCWCRHTIKLVWHKLPQHWCVYYDGDMIWNVVKYVHTLQNIWYALLGEEMSLMVTLDVSR